MKVSQTRASEIEYKLTAIVNRTQIIGLSVSIFIQRERERKKKAREMYISIIVKINLSNTSKSFFSLSLSFNRFLPFFSYIRLLNLFL